MIGWKCIRVQVDWLYRDAEWRRKADEERKLRAEQEVGCLNFKLENALVTLLFLLLSGGVFIVAYFSSWIMTIDRHTKIVSKLCINKTKTAFDTEL